MKLVFTKAAQRDLEQIAIHIATNDIDAALRVVFDIEERARLLLITPTMGRRAAREGVRELVIDNYVLPYRLKGSAIEDLRVWHGRQRWQG
jgi:toxin ParE1/3/4